jgi:hypothetical protein
MEKRNKTSSVPTAMKTIEENKKQEYSKTRKKKQITFYDVVMNTFCSADDGGYNSTKSSARRELPSRVPWIL